MEQLQFQTFVIEQFRIMQEQFRGIHEELRDVKSDIRSMKDDIRHLNDQMADIHQSRNTVKIKFSLTWGIMSLFIAVLAVGISRVFVS